MGDFAKSEADRKMLAFFFFAPNEFGRPYFGPPELPADRLQILRRAFDATMTDKAFMAEADKTQMEVDPITGEEMEKLIADIYATPKELVVYQAAPPWRRFARSSRRCRCITATEGFWAHGLDLDLALAIGNTVQIETRRSPLTDEPSVAGLIHAIARLAGISALRARMCSLRNSLNY